VHGHATAARELARQDFQRGHQPQVGQRRGAQVLGDAALDGDHLVQRAGEVGQPFQRLGGQWHRCGQARPDARGVELGRCEQRAQLVVQVARQAVAFVLARRLQVMRQLGELRRTFTHQRLQAVSFVVDAPLLALKAQCVAQRHQQRPQPDQRGSRGWCVAQRRRPLRIHQFEHTQGGRHQRGGTCQHQPGRQRPGDLAMRLHLVCLAFGPASSFVACRTAVLRPPSCAAARRSPS